MDIPSIDYYNASTITHRGMSKHYPDFVAMLDNDKAYKDLSWTEKLYRYYNHLSDTPRCPICGKPVKFINFFAGYRQFCSNKCLGKSEDIQRKREETTRSHYGVKYPMQSKGIMQKSIDTCIEKYGTKRATSSDDVKKKIQETNINKYGARSPLANISVREKIENTRVKKFIKDHHNIYINNEYHLGSNDIIYTLDCPHPECNACEDKCFDIKPRILYDRERWGIEICTKRLPEGANMNIKSTSLEIFVHDLLDKYKINYEKNIRGIIGGQELDVYIPDKRIAIEINGCFWHSAEFKGTKYHVNKYELCDDQNIQLINLWEDWIINKPEIVKSLILSKLGIFEHRIGASRCIVKMIDSKSCNNFLNDNHIQGRSNSQYRYGLYYKGNLMSVMTFGKKRAGIGSKNIQYGQYELIRYCTKVGWQIIGGASRLLAHFIKDHNPTSIISWSSNDISNGSLYQTLGFHKVGNIHNSYWYVHKRTKERFHRYTFSKDNLIRKKLAPSPDKTQWTESQVMSTLPYFKIYDSGTQCWIKYCT